MKPRWLQGLWAATVLLHGALMLGLVALIYHSAQAGAALLAALAILPLLPSLPGLLRQRPRSGGWACLLVSIYCALLLADVYMHPNQRLPLTVLAVLAAADFVALSLWVKAAAKWAKQQAQASTTAP